MIPVLLSIYLLTGFVVGLWLSAGLPKKERVVFTLISVFFWFPFLVMVLLEDWRG